MEYKGYIARVTFDSDAGVLFGEVDGLRDVITFEATDVRRIEKAFRESVDDYLEMCAKRGEEPERGYSGRFLVRADPQLQRELAREARRSGMSFNAYTSRALRSWLDDRRISEATVNYAGRRKRGRSRKISGRKAGHR